MLYAIRLISTLLRHAILQSNALSFCKHVTINVWDKLANNVTPSFRPMFRE